MTSVQCAVQTGVKALCGAGQLAKLCVTETLTWVAGGLDLHLHHQHHQQMSPDFDLISFSISFGQIG